MVSLIEKQHLLEADIADPGSLAEDGAGRGQRHLAVGGTRKGCRAVYLVIAQPGQRCGADLGLPNVAFGLLGQAHVLPISGCTATLAPMAREP